MDHATRQMLMEMPCASFIGAVGHHAYFTSNAAAKDRIERLARLARCRGIRGFAAQEYPQGAGKAFIANLTQGKVCLVDGNAHMVALLAVNPQLTLASLAYQVGRDDLVRLWQDGWEDGSGQNAAYDVYIPVGTDTARIPETREGTDWFKDPPAPTKIVPATIPFDTPLLSEADRGRPLIETVRMLGL